MIRRRSPKYEQTFFDQIQDSSIQSARALLPIVLSLVQPHSIVDVGCGRGQWLSVCRDLGIEHLCGVDGEYVDRAKLLIRQEEFVPHNLNKQFPSIGTFDLAMCLEVAEHLPSDSANHIVKTLTELAPVVLFSAAIPGQGGYHHFNEQWPSYWSRRFAERGFTAWDCIRTRVWNDSAVLPWYAQNTILFLSRQSLALIDGAKGSPEISSEPLPLVHPGIFGAKLTMSGSRALRIVVSRILSRAGLKKRNGR